MSDEPTPMIRLIYTSVSHIDDRGEDWSEKMDDILTASQTNNSRDGVTGALICLPKCFAQVLEGSEEAVTRTFERIRADARHGDVRVHSRKPIEERAFADWSMGFIGDAPPEEPEPGEETPAAFDRSLLGGDDIMRILMRLAHTKDLRNDVT